MSHVLRPCLLVAPTLIWLCGASILHAQTPRSEDPLVYGEVPPKGAIAVFDGKAIAIATAQQEIADTFLRPGKAGQGLLESLIEEALIEAAVQRKGIAIAPDAVRKRRAELDAGLRKAQGFGIDEQLKRSGIRSETFDRKLKKVVALEAIARSELPIGPQDKVENHHMNAWLQAAKGVAKVVRRPDPSVPANAVATVDGRPILQAALVAELIEAGGHEEQLARTVRVLIEEVTLNEFLASKSIRVGKPEIEAEFAWRKRSFETNPRYENLKYEDLLTQQVGLPVREWKRTREFRIAAGKGALSRRSFSAEELSKAFQEHKGRYGPVFDAAHILVRATDDPRMADAANLRTKKEGRKRAALLLDQIREKGRPFEEIAQMHSADPGSKFKGGRLPSFTPGRNPYEPVIYETLRKLQPGGLSDPVWSPQGWHILKLLAKGPTPTELRPRDEEDLRRFLIQERFNKRLRSAKVGWNLRRLVPSKSKQG